MNVINNNREDDFEAEDDVNAEDGVKTEHGEMIYNVRHRYIGYEYKNVIANIFNYGLKDGDLHLRNVDNWQLGLTSIVNSYLEKNIDVDDKLVNFKKSIKNLANIDD